MGVVMFRLAREPLVQFLLIGALIFAGAEWARSAHSRADHTIVIDNAVLHRIAALYQTQMGTPPTPAQMNALTDDYIKSEILYREALRMGLDKNDEIIKRRLVQKMSFLATADGAPTTTESNLHTYYEAHKADFAAPAEVTFRHVFFSLDEGAKAEPRAEAALKRLTAGGREAGDPFPLESDYAALTPRAARQIFGDTPIVGGLFTAPTGSWQGPFRSGYGLHLVYISARREKTVRPFEEVRSQVQAAVEAEVRQNADDKAYEAMKEQYRIVRESSRDR